MAAENVIEFTNDNFQTEVLDASTPVLVDFWAEWCMPCRMLTPIIEELASDFGADAKVGKMDTDSNRELAVKYGINSIPTVIVFKGGEVHKKFVGLQSKADLEAAINDAK